MKIWLKKLGKWLVPIIITTAITTVIIEVVSPDHPAAIPAEEPLAPNITTSPSANPIWGTADTQNITVIANPDSEPPYSNNIAVTILNPNPYKCRILLRLVTSAGFRFMLMTDSLPPNVLVAEGYESTNIMNLLIKDFAPQFPLELRIPVYTMNPETYSGTEQIRFTTVLVQEEE